MEGIINNTFEKKSGTIEEEILHSRNIYTIANYAKEHRSKIAIDTVRELLESARKIGEEVVENFLTSFKECEEAKIEYLDFESTESGKRALALIETLPQPFKETALTKLEEYKKELAYNTELFKKHNNNKELIWKEVFGFDYYNIPELKERLKVFFFKEMKALSKHYYKKFNLEVKQDPFAITFFVEDPENFEKSHKLTKNASYKYGGFSGKTKETHVNIINNTPSLKYKNLDSTVIHETEHAIHAKTNPFIEKALNSPDLTMGAFEDDKTLVNKEIRSFFMNSLEKAKDEVFAFKKSFWAKEQTSNTLLNKIETPLFKPREGEYNIIDDAREKNPYYDYNEELREANYQWITMSQTLSEDEKQKLKSAIDFLQSEYEKVLKNMIEVVYDNNYSVEFLRNVPINEFWKYSNGKYTRTDFIIKEFKF